MTMKGMLLVSLLLGVSLIDGKRVQADAGGKPPNNMKFTKTSGGCKAWCQKQTVGFPLDLVALKLQANEKCHTDRGMTECADCAGGGLTIPDCREKTMDTEETTLAAVEDTNVAEQEDEEFSFPVDLQPCAKGKDYSKTICSFQGGEICSHMDLAWCPPPSRNAGDTFRLAGAGKPLCCSAQVDSDMDDVDEEVRALDMKLALPVQETEEEKEEEAATKSALSANEVAVADEDPIEPVPICAVDHKFEVDSFKRKDSLGEIFTVSVCRDADTGRFAKTVCCVEAAAKLLQDRQKANDICSEKVDKGHCKPQAYVFDGKRSKYTKYGMPETFSCKRMYNCVYEGKQRFGPVPSQKWCLGKETGLREMFDSVGAETGINEDLVPKNYQAETTCVAVPAE